MVARVPPSPLRDADSLADYGRFEITRLDHDGTPVLEVRGELDLARAAQIGPAVELALEGRPPQLVIDLCRVDFIDSSGLAALLDARRRVELAEASLRVACNIRSVLRLFELTRVDHQLDVYPTRVAALAAGATGGTAAGDGYAGQTERAAGQR